MSLQNFIILTRGRTGSTAIVDEINSHPEVICHQELFLPGSDEFGNLYEKYVNGEDVFNAGTYVLCPFPLFIRAHLSIENWNILPMEKRRGALDLYWDYIISSHHKPGAKALGFKMMWHHDDVFNGVVNYLNKNNFSVIYLKRNSARMVISGMVAKQRNVYNTRQRKAIDAPLHLSVRDFKRAVGNENIEVRQELAFLRFRELPFVEVDYETYLSDRSCFFSMVFSFLGVSPWVPEGTDYQVQINDLRKTISNFDELSEVANEIGCPIDAP